MTSPTFPYVEIAPGIGAWLVGADTCDLIPDHIIMQVANDPLAIAMMRAGYPVAVVEDLMDGSAHGAH